MPSLPNSFKMKDQYSQFQKKWTEVRSANMKHKFISVIVSTKKK